jgi:cysteine desulfurase/selenocysteine lyase
VAKLFNGDPKEFVFTSGATESLNLIAHGLQPFIKAGDEIVLTYGEHGSNLLP